MGSEKGKKGRPACATKDIEIGEEGTLAGNNCTSILSSKYSHRGYSLPAGLLPQK
jgi:hypothetical protein